MNSTYSNQISGHDVEQDFSKMLVDIASDAVLSVQDILTSAFGSRIAVEDKTGFRDLVTEFDRRVEKKIIEHIFRRCPDSVVVGEESGEMGNGTVQWYIDPIDGTTNFSTGIPFFCVSVGAAVKNELVAGVIFDPVRHELFSADLSGARLNGLPIASSHCANESEAILLTDFPYSSSTVSSNDTEFYGRLVQNFGSVRRLGSVALELAYVAAGRVDVAFSALANTWDVAAGLLLVQQAGGQIIHLEKLYTQKHPLTWPVPYFIATGPNFDTTSSILSFLLEISNK